jgi:hypothetical protein
MGTMLTSDLCLPLFCRHLPSIPPAKPRIVRAPSLSAIGFISVGQDPQYILENLNQDHGMVARAIGSVKQVGDCV